jgi:predicted flavoprotein YhiN
MRPHLPLRLATLALLVGALAACGGGGDADEGADSGTTAASVPAASTPATAAADPSEAPITEADFATYERGLEAEIALWRQMHADLRAARAAADSLRIMMLPQTVQEQAARRAGIDVYRYRHLDNTLGQALSARLMNPAMQKAMTADTSTLAQLPKEQADQMRANMREMQAAFSDSAVYRNLPAELHERFKRRAEARLDTLWRERFASLSGSLSRP